MGRVTARGMNAVFLCDRFVDGEYGVPRSECRLRHERGWDPLTGGADASMRGGTSNVCVCNRWLVGELLVVMLISIQAEATEEAKSNRFAFSII